MPGIRRSASTRSTRPLATAASACAPSSASMSRSAMPASIDFTTWRKPASSSAMTTVPTDGVPCGRLRTAVVPWPASLVSVSSPPSSADEPPGVGEPEARAAPPGPWHLVELLEYALKLPGGDPGAGVGDLELDPPRDGARGQPHLAAVGVLDRVGQQVAQDRGQRRLVGQYRGGRPLGADHHVHRLALGHRPGEPAQRGEQRGQADLGRVEDELPRLGLGDVKEVVDQGEQRPRGAPDQPHLVQLLRVEAARRVGEQPGQAR